MNLQSALPICMVVLAFIRCASGASVAAVSTHKISGVIKVQSEAPPRGVLVLGWLTPEEARAWTGPGSMVVFRSLLERLNVVGPVDMEQPVAYQLEAPSGSVPFAMVDVDHLFWGSIFGGKPRWMGIGVPGGGEINLQPPPPPKPRSAVEPCSGDRMKLLVVHAPEVVGTLGNKPDVRMCAYLPPSYQVQPARRYPVVVMLPGLGGHEMSRLRGAENAGTIADGIARDTSQEVILVGVDTRTTFGTSYLVDSPVTGQWESFAAGPMLRKMDEELRTLATPQARAFIGVSTGGFNAISFALRHPDLVAAVGASSPDAPDLDAWLFENGRVRSWILGWFRLEDALAAPNQMASYAADWSPREGGRWAWPLDLKTGKPTKVLDEWRAHSPAVMLQRAEVAERARRSLNGRIFITVGTRDEFELRAPAVVFSRQLARLGIEHQMVETPHGHMDGLHDRIRLILQWLVPLLNKEEPIHGRGAP